MPPINVTNYIRNVSLLLQDKAARSSRSILMCWCCTVCADMFWMLCTCVCTCASGVLCMCVCPPRTRSWSFVNPVRAAMGLFTTSSSGRYCQLRLCSQLVACWRLHFTYILMLWGQISADTHVSVCQLWKHLLSTTWTCPEDLQHEVFISFIWF